MMTTIISSILKVLFSLEWSQESKANGKNGQTDGTDPFFLAA